MQFLHHVLLGVFPNYERSHLRDAAPETFAQNQLPVLNKHFLYINILTLKTHLVAEAGITELGNIIISGVREGREKLRETFAISASCSSWCFSQLRAFTFARQNGTSHLMKQ